MRFFFPTEIHHLRGKYHPNRHQKKGRAGNPENRLMNETFTWRRNSICLVFVLSSSRKISLAMTRSTCCGDKVTTLDLSVWHPLNSLVSSVGPGAFCDEAIQLSRAVAHCHFLSYHYVIPVYFLIMVGRGGKSVCIFRNYKTHKNMAVLLVCRQRL